MSIKSRKLFAILVVAMMILTMLPLTAFATTKNTVNKMPQVEDGHKFDLASAPVLTIKEENDSIVSGNTIRFELRLKNAKWSNDGSTNIFIGLDGNNKGITPEAMTSHITTSNAIVTTAAFYGNNVLSLEVKKDSTNSAIELKIPLITEVDGEGDVEVIVDGRDSPISSGTYVYAVSATGKTITSISKVEKFAGRTVTLASIRIDETRIGALGSGAQDIKLKLPPKYTWSGYGTVNGIGINLTGSAVSGYTTTPVLNTRTLTLPVNLIGGRSARGSLFFEDLQITADRDAPFDDVVVDVDGTNVTATELVVAKRLAYDAEVTIKEVKELLAGRAKEEPAEIKIKANVKGALIKDREVSVALPKWVKINEAKVNGTDQGESNIDGNVLYVKVQDNVDEYKLKLKLSIEADQAGDIVAEFSGAGMEEQELLIAKALAPVTAEIAATDLKIGVQNQLAPNITITEAKKGAIDEGELTITLPSGIKFASAPEAEVAEDGNLEIKKPKLIGDGNKVTIEIKSTSTKPSTIEISDIKLTLDRTVPEGEFKVSVGGSAIVKNLKDSTNTEKWRFEKDNVIKTVFANVITPAPGETHATSVFTIGEATFTVVEAGEAVEYSMDVAPYIKEGRTFLPLRYVANALGVDDDSILWDPVTRAVTIFKGDRIAQVTIGSKTMLVNGVTINMDVAPEITDGRTMLPIRWMAQALGASIDWDAEARTVTVTQ